MSWLRNTSLTLARQLSRSLDPRHDYEPQACYSSFCKHWQQAHDIILKSQPQHLHDDVLGVVNHLEQLVTLLVLEARAREVNPATTPTCCLEHLLTENVLDKLYEWAICTGKYENAVRLEQLKLFGCLVSHYSSQVIAAEPFLRPLLKLLSGFRNELPPPNVENQLITVLNQICVALMQNMQFVDLFFLTTHTRNGSQAEFIIVRLLVSSVHRESAAGSCARDALLLCAKMSARCPTLADYMLTGNTCPVLATGLSGLYSLLPRVLGPGIHRLTPDDVNRIHKLTLFIDSLEFCNAVAQVAHPSIKKHLLDLLYQGFLVPVLGPAILQSGVEEQAAGMAYLELALRCVTERGLLRTVLRYIFTQEYDGVKVIDVLLNRLEGNSQLSLVSFALVETLIDLNCEDVMIELVYKYLLNGHHLMTTHRHKTADPHIYKEAAVAFLTLTPSCCSRSVSLTKKWVDDLAMSGRRVLDYKRDDDSINVNGVQEGIPMNDLVQEIKFNYGDPNETLFGNYHAYLCHARFEIVSRTIACSNWNSRYEVIKKETNNNSSKDMKELDMLCHTKEQDSLISVCTSGYGTLKNSDTSEKEPHSLTSLPDTVVIDSESPKIASEQSSEGREHDSLTSTGESSGYDSFKYKVEEEECESFAVNSIEVPVIRSWKTSAESLIGPLLSSLLRKTASLLQSELLLNCLVTGILSKLVSLPTPILTSLLLCPGYGLQPNVPSLFQILGKLKEEVDVLTSDLENCNELVDKARVFLINREMILVRSRGHVADDYKGNSQEARAQKSEDSFRRGEPKRRTLSNSLHQMFAKLSSSPAQQTTQNSTHTSSPQKRLVFTQDAYWSQSITLRTILNAVLLDEWLKELSALCEEHALRLSAHEYEDGTYIRTAAL